jgi:hypothetical protein
VNVDFRELVSKNHERLLRHPSQRIPTAFAENRLVTLFVRILTGRYWRTVQMNRGATLFIRHLISVFRISGDGLSLFGVGNC